MIKQRLFKWLYKKDFDIQEQQKATIKALVEKISHLEEVLNRKEIELFKRDTRELTQEEVMRWCLKTLGMTFIDFSNVDEDGKPPHYLDSLTPEQRKDWIAHLETIYADPKFQAVVSYTINLIGNHAMQKAEDSQMRNGKIGIIGIRTLMSEFLQAHEEYVDSRKPTEEFDTLAIMPE